MTQQTARLHQLLDNLVEEMSPPRGPEDGTVQSERAMQRYHILRVQEARLQFETELMSLMDARVAEAGGIGE